MHNAEEPVSLELTYRIPRDQMTLRLTFGMAGNQEIRLSANGGKRYIRMERMVLNALSHSGKNARITSRRVNLLAQAAPSYVSVIALRRPLRNDIIYRLDSPTYKRWMARFLNLLEGLPAGHRRILPNGRLSPDLSDPSDPV